MKKCMTLGRISVSVLLALVMLVSSFVGMITISAEETETETSASGIIGISVSLEEDIIVNFKTTAEADDGSSVKLTFNGKDYELTAHASDTFSFVNVTPQNMGDLITARMYKDGDAVGDEKTFSVQSYLETLLSYEFGSEFCTCKSKLQHTALHELCVNMLNYGAAAQTYVNHDTENLANKNLSDVQKALATEKIAVNETDKAVSGSAWVGAGVRFDYKLGLYFVFRAASATEYTATINGAPAEIEAYPSAGADCYVIRYNGFNATNMNDVVTAKLTKDGADEQTFAYSVKSYVASKGGDSSNIANLVNAMYTYGFAAVAYSAEYVEVKPTFETAGSLTMDGKGYDFSESVYGSVVLPVLTAANYDTNTTNSGTETAPKVTTEFILKHKLWAYSLKFDDATDCVNIDGILASEYDYTKFNNEKITVARDDTKGYTVTATNATLTTLATYGAELTIKGTLTMDLTPPEGATTNPTWTLYNNTTLGDGTEDGKATVTVVNAADNGVVLNGSTADMLVTKESTLSDNIISVNNSTLIVDGTVTANTRVQSAAQAPTSGDYETGYRPSIYIRSGTLTADHIKTNCMQIGSEKDNLSGILNLTGPNWEASSTRKPLIFRTSHNANSRHFWLNGTINAANTNGGESALIDCKAGSSTSYTTHVVVGKKMSFNFDPTVDTIFYCSQSHNATQYWIYWHADVTIPVNNFMYTNTQNVNVYIWKEADVKLDGAEDTTKVIVTGYYYSGGKWIYRDTNLDGMNGVEGADLTTVTTDAPNYPATITDSRLGGTLKKATYTDAAGTAHTVYYRELG